MSNNIVDELVSKIGAVLADPAHLHEYTLVVTPEVHKKISQCLTEERGVLYFCGLRVSVLTENLMKTFFTAPFTAPFTIPSNAYLFHNGHIVNLSNTHNFGSGRCFLQPVEDKLDVTPDEPENTAIEDFLNSIPIKKETGHAAE